MTGGGNRLDGLGICNVEPDGLCRQASVAQGSDLVLQDLCRARREHRVRTMRGGGLGDRQPDAPASAGDQCGAPLKREHSCVVHAGCHLSSGRHRVRYQPALGASAIQSVAHGLNPTQRFRASD